MRGATHVRWTVTGKDGEEVMHVLAFQDSEGGTSPTLNWTAGRERKELTHVTSEF